MQLLLCFYQFTFSSSLLTDFTVTVSAWKVSVQTRFKINASGDQVLSSTNCESSIPLSWSFELTIIERLCLTVNQIISFMTILSTWKHLVLVLEGAHQFIPMVEANYHPAIIPQLTASAKMDRVKQSRPPVTTGPLKTDQTRHTLAFNSRTLHLD